MLAIDLTGKRALVLGGSRGIGAGIVETLCKAGAYTVFTHTGNPKNTSRIEDLTAGIENEGVFAGDDQWSVRAPRISGPTPRSTGPRSQSRMA